MLHEKVHYKKSEWPKFNEAMKALINESYELVELSIIDHGDFKFRPQYEHLAVPQRRWFQMTPQQRQHHMRPDLRKAGFHARNNKTRFSPSNSSCTR